MADAAFSYCAELARRFDRERWLAALLAPPEARRPLFALLAFNYEVAKTRESVSQPMLGQIRLQWWRESIASIYEGRPREHQVVQALAEAIRARPLERARFDRLIDARESDLLDLPFATLDELEAYAAATGGELAGLEAEALGVEAADAARLAGAAWTLMGLLRALPGNAPLRRLTLPHVALEPEDVFRGRATAAVRAAVRAVVERAQGLAAQARAQRPPRRALPALPPLRLVDFHARRLRAAGFDPFAADGRAGAAAAPLRVAWSRLAGL